MGNQNQKAKIGIYIQGTPRKKQYHCFFCEAPKVSRKIDFYTCTLDFFKIKKLESGHYTFWNCYIQGAPRKKQ